MYGELKSIIQAKGQPIMLMGDFNEILTIEDRRGQSRYSESMKLFKDFVEDNGLMDVKLKNLRYTWARGNSRTKLDRCL